MWINGYIEHGTAEYWTAVVWLLLLLVVGTVANTLLLVTILKANYVRGHNSAVLLIGLCCTDLYMTVVAIPLHLTYIMSGYHVLGESVCLVSSMLHNSVSCVALWSIALSSIDRLLAVSRPMVYRQRVTLKRVVISLVVLCFISVAASSPLFLSASHLDLCGDHSRVTAHANTTPHTFHVRDDAARDAYYVYLLVYELLCPVLPLLISVLAYFGIFLAARNLRKREIARKKMIDEVNRRSLHVQQNTMHVQQTSRPTDIALAASVESGIHMEESTLSDEVEIEEELPIARKISAARISKVMSPEVLKTIRFSNHTVFLESLDRTFFSSTLIEDQLNKSYEDYFSDCLMDVENTSMAEMEDIPGYRRIEIEDITSEEEVAQIPDNSTHSKVRIFRWNSSDRSRTERLRIKTAVLLSAVIVILTGSHLPGSLLMLANRSVSGAGVLIPLLPFVVYAVNPLLFGFLNNTLRSKAAVMFCTIGRSTTVREEAAATRGPAVKQYDSLAKLRKWRRRLSQTSLLRDFKKGVSIRSDDNSELLDPSVLIKQSNISVLSDKSILRDQMTMRYFETNL